MGLTRLPRPTVDKSKDTSTAIVAKTTKHNGNDLCLPKAKRICLAPSALGESHLTSLHSSIVCSETLNILQTVQVLLGGRTSNVLINFVDLYL